MNIARNHVYELVYGKDWDKDYNNNGENYDICPKCEIPFTVYEDRNLCEQCGMFNYNPYYLTSNLRKRIRGSTYNDKYHANKLLKNYRIDPFVKSSIVFYFINMTRILRSEYGMKHMPKYNYIFDKIMNKIICIDAYKDMFVVNLSQKKIDEYDKIFDTLVYRVFKENDFFRY